VDGVAVRSPIRPIWTWRGQKCKPVRCHDGRVQPCNRFAPLQVVDVDHTL